LIVSSTALEPHPDRTHLAAWRIQLDDTGRLLQHERVALEHAGTGCWHAWMEVAADNDRYNGAAYLDVLNPVAVQAFIASTHEVYRRHFGGSFPADVPAIFTDEPQWISYIPLARPDGNTWARCAWTPDLPESFRQAWDVDMFDILPAVFWPTPAGPSPWRWRFWDHLCERFASAFADQLDTWCADHGIALTGHLMQEASLASQMGSVGECMRHYRGFQIPGIDILCDHYEPTTAKQAVSVARQEGRDQVLSELYGVTDWDFPFAGHKVQGDWQAALGITLRVHHLTWLSMAGDSKRDYPASIGPQSPWYREYPLIENHFARVNAALEQGQALVRIAVIHPIESFWLLNGIRSSEGVAAASAGERFVQITDWLLEAQLDFDYVAESLLPQQWRRRADGRLQVGAMVYDAVLLPDLLTLRRSTLQALQGCAPERVLICGAEPTRLDAEPGGTGLGQALADLHHIPWSRAAVVQACESWRTVGVQTHAGGERRSVLYQLRQLPDGERILFCCNRQRESAPSHHGHGDQRPDRLYLPGRWRVRELDTATGTEVDCPHHQDGAETVVPWLVEPHGHRLLRLVPDADAPRIDWHQAAWRIIGDCPEPDRVDRTEDNVLLLDRAAWRIDGGAWQEPTELLQIAGILRDRFAWPSWQQPYSIEDAGPEHRLELRLPFTSKLELDGLRLVCERVEEAIIHLDGKPLATQADGWWVDRDLPTVPVPPVSAGRHELHISLPMDARRRFVEWCYLLGDVGVSQHGGEATLTAWDPQLHWGDATRQGLPFYGGNLIYASSITVAEAGRYALRCPRFGAPLLRISCDGIDKGPCAFAPHRVDLGHLEAGEHRVRITAFGHRRNCFGAVHNDVPGWHWWGPTAWQVGGADHNPVWQLRPTGLLRPPLLERHD
ncbi:MAG: hypothetical protein ACOCXJ_06875, partial [Planctomycetota bacterium]